MRRHARIELDPEVMLGKPVIRGTRITVEHVLRELADGASEDALLEIYPRITRRDIRAALRYASELVHEQWARSRSAAPPALLSRNATPAGRTLTRHRRVEG